MKKLSREYPFVVMAAIHSPNHLLLIQNILDPSLRWKFMGESNEEGEEPLETLARGVWEECALMLQAAHDMFGHIIELGDRSMICTVVREPVRIFGRRGLYTQYFYKLETTDTRLRDLSGKRFDGGDRDEFFETRAFRISEIPSMPDFLPHHRRLYNEFLISCGREPVTTFAYTA